MFSQLLLDLSQIIGMDYGYDRNRIIGIGMDMCGLLG